MQKIKTSGNAFTITSDLKFDEIVTLQEQAPHGLVLSQTTADGSYVELFRVGVRHGVIGDIDDNGILFAGKDADGYATYTGLIPANESNKKQFLFDNYANAINCLKIVEEKAKIVAKECITTKKEFLALIEDLDKPADSIRQPGRPKKEAN